MKKRNSFVINSSSSSFVVEKRYLTKLQIKAIKSHIHYARKRLGWFISPLDFPWRIIETKSLIKGSASMDNFDMRKFMQAFDIDLDKVDFSH